MVVSHTLAAATAEDRTLVDSVVAVTLAAAALVVDTSVVAVVTSVVVVVIGKRSKATTRSDGKTNREWRVPLPIFLIQRGSFIGGPPARGVGRRSLRRREGGRVSGRIGPWRRDGRDRRAGCGGFRAAARAAGEADLR